MMPNFAKFSQNKELANKLILTGKAILAEASPYDMNYGIGFDMHNTNATKPEKWKGKNILGTVLMNVRERISKEEGC